MPDVRFPVDVNVTGHKITNLAGGVDPTDAATFGQLSVGAGTPVTLTDAATIVVDATLGSTFVVTISGSRTLGNPTGAINGQMMRFIVIQDGTGGRTLALDTKYRYGAEITSVTIASGAGDVSYIGVIYFAASDKFDVVAVMTGY